MSEVGKPIWANEKNQQETMAYQKLLGQLLAVDLEFRQLEEELGPIEELHDKIKDDYSQVQDRLHAMEIKRKDLVQKMDQYSNT